MIILYECMHDMILMIICFLANHVREHIDMICRLETH